MNYSKNQKVLVNVRNNRIIYDETYKKDKPKIAVAIISNLFENKYIVLVEDSKLGSWIIQKLHCENYGIDLALEGKNGYTVEVEAIGGLAPHQTYCIECQLFNKKMLNSFELSKENLLEN